MPSLIQKAYAQLYDGRECPYEGKVTYSKRFSDYNANIKLRQKQLLDCGMSIKWKGISQDIQIGLIQSLLVKLFGRGENTLALELYNLFIKNLHLSVPKDSIDSELEKRFHSLNQRFFMGQLEIPNLIWGSFSRRKLGSYDFQTDTIRLSTVLKEVESELLDYVLYHEMLHKHFQFTSSGNTHRFHSTEFRKAEKLFPDANQIENKLRYLPKRPRSAIFQSFKTMLFP